MYSLLLTLTLAISAVDTAAVVTELPEVSVVATRVGTVPTEAPGRVTVLGPEAIAATGSRSVADLLEARSIASIRRYGPGGLASVSLRGTGASQTLVLLDGHRIADPQLGQLDLSLLPTVLLDRVEIMHGAGSALHGTDGIGGVVDLRTLRPDLPGADAAAVIGAFGERSATARASASGARIGGIVAAEATQAEGDFPFGDPHTGAVRRRTGADQRMASAFGRVEARMGDVTASAAAWVGSADRGVPGSVGAPLASRQEDRQLRIWGSVGAPIPRGSIRLGGLLQKASIRYDGDLGRTTLASAELETRTAMGRWMLVSGIVGGIGSAEHPQLDDLAREARLGAFIAATGDFGRLLVYPALRGDYYLGRENAGAISPRIGLNWQPLPDLPVRFKLGAGSAFRAPTFNDRYWRYAGTDAGGDPNLRPERAWTADGGAFVDLGPLRFEGTLYHARMRDQIVWRPGAGGLFEPTNVGRTETTGLETTLETAPLPLAGSTFSAGLTHALTAARDVTDPESPGYGRQLRYVPRHQVKGYAGIALPITASTSLRLDVNGRYVARRPIRIDGTLDQPPHFVADAQARLSHAFANTAFAWTIGLENVLDADYAILRGYPMPPRHARTRLHITF